MSRTSRVQRFIGASVLLSVIAFAVTTCGSEKLLKPQPSSLARVSGDAQSGTVGAALASPVIVKVVDGGGAGIPGVAVEWSVVSGGGSVTPASSATDATGTASATWTLGVTAGPNSLSVSLPVNAGVSPVTFSATGLPGPAAQLFLTTAAAGAASGAAFTTQPVVALRDAHGNAVTTDNNTVVSMTVSSGASVVGTATAKAVAGIVTFSGAGISGTAGTAYTLTFASGTLTAATEAITPTPGAAATLVLTTGAAGAPSGAAFATQPVVTLKDGAGNTATGDNATVVTMTVSSGATVVGTATARASSGVATFTNVGISGTAGTVYTLTFASGTLTAATSSITPTAGAASQLALATAAVGAASGASFTTQPAVVIRDGVGNRVTDDNSTVVTMTVSAGGTVVGTATATAANGLATFANVGISGTAGTVYTLTFASGKLTAAAQTITPYAGAANHVMVLTSAAGAASGAPFGTQPVVAICDAAHNVVTTDNSSVVTMTVSSGATIVGTATAKATSGVATFSGVGICGKAGTGYTLTFSSGSLTAATHVIAPTAGAGTKLALTTPAAGAVSGAAFATQPVVEVQDAEGNTVTTDNSTVVKMTVSSGAGVVGVAQVTASNGVAAFGSVGITGIAGTVYTLNFAGGSFTPVTQSITPTPGGGSKLVLTTSAAGAPSGAAFTTQPVVAEQDAQGNTVTTDNSTVVTMTVSTGASVVGTATATVASGVATFANVGVTGTAGTAYTLTFKTGSLSSATQSITPGVGPVATSTSTVNVSPSTVKSGEAVTLTLQAKDAGGNNLTTGGLTVAFNASAGTGVSTGTISATTDLGNGNYTATFTGVLAGSPTTIGATIGGSAVTTSLPTVGVTVGPVSTATSTVSVSSPTVGAGSNVTLTLQAKDIGGNNLTSGGLTVAFAPSTGAGVSTGTISPTTDNGNGTYTATFTGGAAGTATTIHATIGGTAVTWTPLPTVTVTAANASTSTSTVSVSSGTVASGSSVTLILQSKDPNGNNLTSGGLAVLFNASTGTGVSTGAIGATTDHGDGTYTAMFTGALVGTPTTIGATIGGVAVTSTLPTVRVTEGLASASTSTVTVSSGTVVAGNPVTLTLRAKDAQGNDLTAGGLTVAFTASTGAGVSTGTIGSVADHGNGTYTATFTGQTAGTATTIQAMIGVTSVTSPLPTVTVTVGDPTPATSTVTVASGTVVSGSALLLTLQAKDIGGNNVTSGGRTVAFTASTGTGVSTGTIGSPTDNGNGTYTATFTGVLAGTATTVGATMDGVAVVSTTLVTVTPGAASVDRSTVTVSSGTVKSGEWVTVTLTARDAAGNQLAGGGLSVNLTAGFTIPDGSNGSLSGMTDHGNGTYTSSFTGVKAGTAPAVIEGWLGGTQLNTAPAQVTVTPGVPSSAAGTSTISPSGSLTLKSGDAVTLTLDAKDAAGNSVPGASVSFSYTGGASTVDIGSVTPDGSGKYAVNITGSHAGTGATTISATIAANGGTATVTGPNVRVEAGPVSAATSTVAVASASVVSGSSVLLTLQAKDAASNNLTSGGLTVAFTASGGASTGTISGTTDNGNGTYTATFTGKKAGTGTTIGATIGLTNVTSSPLPTVTVTPGPASVGQSTVSVSSATVLSGNSVTLTLQAKDAEGNNLTTDGLSVAFTASGGTSTGSIVPHLPDYANYNTVSGTYTATFTAYTAGTSTTISATINGVAVTTTLPTVTVTPGVPSNVAGTSTVSPSGPLTVKSGDAATLTLDAKDAAGNSVPGGTVNFSYTGGTSTVNIGSVTPDGAGKYAVDITGYHAGTSATRISATITANGGTATVTGPDVTVEVGPVSAATSTLSVSSSTVTSGSLVTLKLQAKDAAGNNLTTGGLSVVFWFTGGASLGTVSPTTDNGDGTYTATFTGNKVGTATIGATIGMIYVTSPSPTVVVTPGPASINQSTVSVSSGTVLSGNPVTLTLQPKDAAGNNVKDPGITVAFTNTTGTGLSTGTIDPSPPNNAHYSDADGTYTATFTAVLAGDPTTIGATINGVAVPDVPSKPLPTVTVTPGVPSATNSKVTPAGPITLKAGDLVTLTLDAKDAAGNSVTGGTVGWSYTGGTSTVEFDPAGHEADVIGAHAGTATTVKVTITANGGAATVTGPDVTVELGPISAKTSTITASGSTVMAGNAVVVTLQLKDPGGNNLETPNQAALFSFAGGASTGTFGAVTDVGNGTYTATFTGMHAGTPTTIHATINGANVTSTPLPTVEVTLGPISPATSTITVPSGTVPAGGIVTVTLHLKDPGGNDLTTSGQAVTFYNAGGTSTGTFGTVTYNVVDGTYTADFTADHLPGTPTTIHATINGSEVTSTLPTVEVTPGPASTTTSTVSASPTSLSWTGIFGPQTATVTLQAKDAWGNNLTSGLLSVAFQLTGSGASVGAATDNLNGTYTATVTATGMGTVTVHATIGGVAVTTTPPTINIGL